MTESLRPSDRRSLLAELGDPEEYRYVDPRKTAEILGEFGYGDPWKWVQAVYHRPASADRPAISVGVMHIDGAIGENHFGIVPGVLIAEAANQTALLHGRLTGQIVGDARPLLAFNACRFHRPTTSRRPVDLNVVIQQIPNVEGFQLRGTVLLERNVVAEIEVQGAIATTGVIDRIKNLSERAQARATPLFPLR